MTADRQSRIHDLFAAAIDEELASRDAFLRRECAGDVALYDEVRSLLAHHDAASGFIEKPAAETVLRAVGEESDGAIPDTIGAYRVIRKLGEGGMGVVYLAEQQQPRRVVALKVVRSGISSRALNRRFEHEAEVLGRLQHPGIAQIFEAGLARVNGRSQPYFALEYIEGRPLTDYAKKVRLDIRGRLLLIARICEAVHHAHQKGVIHRDLKPGNILVDATGQPKILDFGVARVTDADVHVTTFQTDVGQLIGTIPYMSPEQVAGRSELLDTRSDVYALGVIAYELLTGRLPHDLSRKIITEAARIIREDDPAPISAINRALRGDIETIVLKALEKDRDRRYASGSEFAADIRRYLNDEPIVARPASALYQLRKFARRNKAIVVAACVVVFSLAGGLIYSNVQRGKAVAARDAALLAQQAEKQERQRAVEAERVAREEAEVARLESRKSERVVAFLQDMLASASPVSVSDKDVTVAEVVERALETVDTELKNEPIVLASIQTTMGRTLACLARYDDAEELLQRALASQTALLPEAHPDRIQTLRILGTLRKLQGRYDDAESALTEAVMLAKQTHGAAQYLTAQAINDLGTVRLRLGRFTEALADFREAISILQAGGDTASSMRFEILGNVGYALAYLHKYDDAETALSDALDVARSTYGERSTGVASLLNNLAHVRRAQGDMDGAIAATREAHEIDNEIYGAEHPKTIRSLSNLGVLLRRSGKLDEAERIYRDVVTRRTAALGPDHPTVGNSLANLGFLLTHTGRFEEARTHFERALDVLRKSLPGDHIELANLLSNYGEALMGLERWADAEAAFRESRDILLKSKDAEHWSVGTISCKLGRSILSQGRVDDAVEMIERGVDILTRDGQGTDEADRGLATLIEYYTSVHQPDRAARFAARRAQVSVNNADAEP